MSAKIYYNPNCGTCRNTKAIMEEAGQMPEIIEYLKTPPSKEELETLLKDMNIGPQEALRRKGNVYEELDIENRALSNEELIVLMTENPVLIERPIVVTSKGTKICRPAEEVKTLL